MTLVKLNPFSPITYKNVPAFDRALDEVLNRSISSFFNDEAKLFHTVPAANVVETEKSFNLDIAVPGLTKEDFKIEIENKALVISAEKKIENETKDETTKFVRREFGYSNFKRSFTLPENVDVSSIAAQYNNGVLSIEIPKAEPKKTAHVVEVK